MPASADLQFEGNDTYTGLMSHVIVVSFLFQGGNKIIVKGGGISWKAALLPLSPQESVRGSWKSDGFTCIYCTKSLRNPLFSASHICRLFFTSPRYAWKWHREIKNLYKSCILLRKFNNLPSLVRDKEIYSTRAGSILTSAGPAWDLRVQLMEHEGEDQWVQGWELTGRRSGV